VQREFIARGMVADFSIHRDDPNNPHAHILLTLRAVTQDGFGLKERGWNDRARLMDWRRGWEEVTNEFLAQAGLAVRIDHRSLRDQGLSLAPGRKIGVGLERQASASLPHHVADRIAEQKQIAHENGARIVENPALALQALTHTQATFTRRDIARFLHTRTDGAEQFQSALLKVTTSPDLVCLGSDDRNQERFTSREMLALEKALLSDADRLSQRRGHGVSKSRQVSVLSQHRLSVEQRSAFEHLVGDGDLKALVGVAGSGKSRLLAAAREAWQAQGYSVKGAALSGIAAENLATSSGIASRTLASLEYAWKGDREPLTARDVLVIDETGMVGTRQLARVLAVAQAAHAKVVMVGDPEQLQAIEAGAPFRALVAETGTAQLHEVKRQRHAWQREATQQFTSGRTADALMNYEQQGLVIQVATHAAARQALLARAARDAQLQPEQQRLMLAYTREDVRELNTLARTLRQQQGELGRSEPIHTALGVKNFAVHDRLYFLRNEKSLEVKNGSLGTIEAIKDGVLQVRLDANAQRVAVDTRFYQDLDYGYAATVHKAQGSTVDRSYVLATPHYDRHAAYVALSRHRESATVFYAAEDFDSEPNEASPDSARRAFLAALSRSRPKEFVHDYLERDPEPSPPVAETAFSAIDAIQRQSAERWRATYYAPAAGGKAKPTLEEQRQEAVQKWLEQRRRLGAQPAPDADKSPGQKNSRDQGYDIEDD
jgi:Ti-type conjugative transfer relaxase TraA